MHRFLNNNKKSFDIAYACFVTELHHFHIISLIISWDFTFHFRLNVSVNITSISKPFSLNFVPEERQENPSFCSCIFILITCLILRVLDKMPLFLLRSCTSRKNAGCLGLSTKPLKKGYAVCKMLLSSHSS